MSTLNITRPLTFSALPEALSYSQTERDCYNELWFAASNGLPTLNGKSGVSFFSRFGLNRAVLHDIWSMCDESNSGELTIQGFYRACRLVAHAQSGRIPSVDLFHVEPSRLPAYVTAASAASLVPGVTAPHLIGMDGSSRAIDRSEAEGFWRPSAADVDKYTELFHAISVRTGSRDAVEGREVKRVLLKSGLSGQTLAEAWDLCDVDKDGKLVYGEFLALMHLVTVLRESIPSVEKSGLGERGSSSLGLTIAVPPTLPADLAKLVHLDAPEKPTGYDRSGRGSPRSGSPGRKASGSSSPRNKSGQNDGPVDHKDGQADRKDEQAKGPDALPLRESVPSSMGLSRNFAPSQAELTSQAELASQAELTKLEDEFTFTRKDLAVQTAKRVEMSKNLEQAGSSVMNAVKEKAELTVAVSLADKEIERLQNQVCSVKAQHDMISDELTTYERFTSRSLSDLVAADPEAESHARKKKILELKMAIEHRKRTLEDLAMKKAVLMNQKTQAEQDRTMLSAAVEQERVKLIAVRADRLKLWEQRHAVTREISRIKLPAGTSGTGSEDHLSASYQGVPSFSGELAMELKTGSAQAVSSSSARRDKKGVRADDVGSNVRVDTGSNARVVSSSPVSENNPGSSGMNGWSTFSNLAR